jgi:hypothetical protein
MPVIPVNKVVDLKRIIGKRRAGEEERHKGSLTPPKMAIYAIHFVVLLEHFFPFWYMYCTKENLATLGGGVVGQLQI